MSYPDYLDAATTRMLQAEPGGLYEVAVAPGRAPGLPLPPGGGRWTEITDPVAWIEQHQKQPGQQAAAPKVTKTDSRKAPADESKE